MTEVMEGAGSCVVGDFNIDTINVDYDPSLDLRIKMIKEMFSNVGLYKCPECPFMTFSMKDIKLHAILLHQSADTYKDPKSSDEILLKCPGCENQFYTEMFLKVHLYDHHRMSVDDTFKLMLYIGKGEHFPRADDNPTVFYDTTSYLEVHNDGSERLDYFEPEYERIDETSDPDRLYCDNNLPNVKLDQNMLSVDSNYVNDLNNQIVDIPKADEFQPTEMFIDLTTRPEAIVNEKPPQQEIFVDFQGKFPEKPDNRQPEDVEAPNDLNTPSEISENGFKCTVANCNVRLNSSKNMSYHKLSHVDDTKNLRCPECKKEFTTVEVLHNHIWKQHQIDLELHSCDQCSYKSYSRNRLINTHVKIHSSERNYVCKTCSKTFKNSKQLSNHCSIHKKVKTAKMNPCNICKREFGNKSMLMMHFKNVHEKVKLFYCNSCEYSTSLKTSLILHLRLHTGEKPYHCANCDFKSSNRCTLKRHLMQHSQQKRYKCDICSYSCIQASSIKSHIMLKHPGAKTDLLHSCPHCTYTTVNKTSFAAHLFIHEKSGTNKSGGTDTATLQLEPALPDHVDQVCDLEQTPIKVTNFNQPIYVKNIGDLTSDSITTILSSGLNNNTIPLQTVDDQSIAKNTIFIQNVETINNSVTRKKPKIYVKSNLILKGPDSDSETFIHNPADLFLPQHLIIDEQNTIAPDQLCFDNNDPQYLNVYDSFHSDYSMQNFPSPNANTSDIAQYILGDVMEALKDKSQQMSVEMKEENLKQSLNTDLNYINLSDDKAYLTFIQSPIKCEEKLNTDYVLKQSIEDYAEEYRNSIDGTSIDDIPIVVYDTSEIENY